MIRMIFRGKSNDNMDREAASRVYEQYWGHARHLEIQLHSFINFYAVIVAGALAFAATTGNAERISLGGFIAGLSILGFLFNNNLRVPFVKFTLISELIAICELGLKDEYRRFFDSEGKLAEDKPIDTYDLVAWLFVILATLSCASVAAFSIDNVRGLSFTLDKVLLIGGAAALTLTVGASFYAWTKGQLNGIKRDIEQNVPRAAGSGE